MLTTKSSPSVHAASPSFRSHYQTSQTTTRSPKHSPHTFRRPQPPISPKTTPTLSDHRPRRSPRIPHTSDAGTQYSPTDWPPTSSRSSLKTTSDSSGPKISENPVTTIETPQTTKSPTLASPEAGPPPEPSLGQTPKAPLEHDTVSTRRSHSAVSRSNEGSPGAVQGSTPKRIRGEDASAKIVPIDYTKCDPKDLALMVSDLIMDLIRVNDDLPLGDDQLTRFHSRVPPAISVRDYLQRLTFHATLSPPLLLSMVNYIDTLCKNFPSFTVNSLTVHRFLITAACCSAKALSDAFWTNSTYAKVGGVSLRELAMLELELLIRMDWRMVPTPESLVDYYRNLVARNSAFKMEQSPSPRSMSSDSEDLSVSS